MAKYGMKLSDFLAREKLNPANFAARIGVAPSTVSRLLRRRRKPSLDLMQRIAEATHKEVSTLDDFTNDGHAEPSPLAEAPPKRAGRRGRGGEVKVTLPQSLCEDLGWKPGDSLVTIPHGDGLLVRRAPKLEDLREMLKDADASDYRDRNDRY
jgi:transcriptional regulator with XRE-family HTH domain